MDTMDRKSTTALHIISYNLLLDCMLFLKGHWDNNKGKQSGLGIVVVLPAEQEFIIKHA